MLENMGMVFKKYIFYCYKYVMRTTTLLIYINNLHLHYTELTI